MKLPVDKLDQALALAVKELAVTREVLGEQHDDVVGSLEILARLHELREDWVAARKALAQVVAIRQRQPDQKNWRIADARRALADLDRRVAIAPAQRRRLKEADRLQRIQDSRRRQGKYAEAIELGSKVTAIRGELLGKNHPDYINSLNNLAVLYQSDGRLRKGRASFPPSPGGPQEGAGREPPRLCHQPEQSGRALPGYW